MSASGELIYAQFGENCDLYDVLGVTKSATEKEITRAYRKLALKYVRACIQGLARSP